MPERLAKMPATAPLTEVMGSGPFLFKRDEWVPGNKAVFVRNPNYVGRAEPPSGLSGNKKPHFDRVEWLYLPDSNSSTAALKNGEVDLIEQVPPDYITPLRADPNIKLGSGGSYQGFIVMNQLIRRSTTRRCGQAVLHAVNQEKFVAGMGYPLDMRLTYCSTWFICGGRTRPMPAPSRTASPISRRRSSCSPKAATRARRSSCCCRPTSRT
jgi:peptide/nickel transport system substrate-binding protein